jgi:hypothetical protein
VSVRIDGDGELVEPVQLETTKRKIGLQTRGKKLGKAAWNLWVIFIIMVFFASILGFCAFLLWTTQEPERNLTAFAQSFLNSEVASQGTFHLGESGSPVHFTLIDGIKEGAESRRNTARSEWEVETIPIQPTKYDVRNCTFFALREGATEVYALTVFAPVDKISVHLPPQNSGIVNVCTVAGHTVEVVLWSN